MAKKKVLVKSPVKKSKVTKTEKEKIAEVKRITTPVFTFPQPEEPKQPEQPVVVNRWVKFWNQVRSIFK